MSLHIMAVMQMLSARWLRYTEVENLSLVGCRLKGAIVSGTHVLSIFYQL